MDPSYGFAGMFLFDLQLGDGDLDAAAATLAALKKVDDDAYVRAREVKLAARRGDRPTALKALREVARMKVDSDWPVDAAVQAVTDAGWSGWQADAAEALHEALTDLDAAPVAARQWVRLSIDAGDWGCAAQLDALLERGEVGRAALEGYVHSCGWHRQARRLAECVTRYRDALRGGTRTWGTVGYAYARLDDYAAVCEWLSDWQSREGVQPWMLTNLVLALRAGGRDAEANAVSRHVISLPRDADVRYHRVWLAYDEALAGRAAEALHSLGDIAPGGLDHTHRFIRVLVEALAAVQEAKGKWTAFTAARRLLAAAAKSCSPLEEDARVVAVAYQTGLARLGKDGGLVARLWALWRQLLPLLPAPPVARSQGK
jgi:hypothetical protein